MVETFFGFKKSPFGDNPDAKQLFASQSWTQVKARLQFLVDHHGAGLLTGEVGAGKSTAARAFTAGLNPNLYKVLYLHWTCGSALDLLRQLVRDRAHDAFLGRRRFPQKTAHIGAGGGIGRGHEAHAELVLLVRAYPGIEFVQILIVGEDGFAHIDSRGKAMAPV